MPIAAYRAELLSVPDDPVHAGGGAIRHFPDGMLVVEEGHIIASGDHADLAPRFVHVPVQHFPGRMILPGFIDTHIHYPQTDRIAAHGEQLLDWLERHIFPAEMAFADRRHADGVAVFFLTELLRNGTTSALVFPTVHAMSVDALFAAALERNMRLISGKVLMDQGAPEGLRDTAESAYLESAELIARWHGRGRLGYAVTPRFVLTSSDEQLDAAGRLLAEHPEVLMHTHLAENHAEIAAVKARFPETDYLGVYDRFGLVGPRSVFAHCVHMDDDAMGRMARAGASIAYCPTSNLFLGSGLFDLKKAAAHGVKVGMGTDVGAGTSFSILSTLGEAYKVGQLRGASLDPFRALHLATAGGAKALGISDKVGALLPGQEADFILVDPAATPLLARRTAGAPLHEKLFALQILGDDRAIARTWVAGQMLHDRDAA